MAHRPEMFGRTRGADQGAEWPTLVAMATFGLGAEI